MHFFHELWIDASDSYRIRLPLHTRDLDAENYRLARTPRCVARQCCINGDIMISGGPSLQSELMKQLGSMLCHVAVVIHWPRPSFINILPGGRSLFILSSMGHLGIYDLRSTDSADNGACIVVVVFSKPFNECHDVERYLSLFMALNVRKLIVKVNQLLDRVQHLLFTLG